MIKYSLVILMVFAFAKAKVSQAQSTSDKLEKEEQIQENRFPKEALQITSLFSDGKSVKYFKEYDGDKTSLEAKFKKEGKRYSIEFSESGSLEDVEIEIKRKEIDKVLWQAIESSLDSIADRWRIEKIQEQYLPKNKEPDEIIKLIKKHGFDHLELIVAFKSNRKIYRKEILVGLDGTILKERNVKRLAYDFLLF